MPKQASAHARKVAAAQSQSGAGLQQLFEVRMGEHGGVAVHIRTRLSEQDAGQTPIWTHKTAQQWCADGSV